MNRILRLIILFLVISFVCSCSSCQEHIIRAKIPQSADPVKLAAQLSPRPVWPPNFQKLIPTTADAELEESYSLDGNYYVRYRSNMEYYKITQFYIDELRQKGYSQLDDSNDFDKVNGVHYQNNDPLQPEFWLKIEKYSNCNRVIIQSAQLINNQQQQTGN